MRSKLELNAQSAEKLIASHSPSADDIATRANPYRLYRLASPGGSVVAEILRGLRRPQKKIDPKFFYDTRGSQLYERITQTFDYYVTRTENEILLRHAEHIAARIGRTATVIEPGAGNCRKIEYLLEALHPDVYVPIDVSYATLEEACMRLSANYRWLQCIGVMAEFDQLDRIEGLLPMHGKFPSLRKRLAFFPGSTLGNMDPVAAADFLRRLRRLAGSEGGILIGVDNVKDEAILQRAYNDAAGLTAAFNKNVLLRINRIAGADFVPDNFEHRAFFNRAQSRIEMHLVSKIDQIVNVAGENIIFDSGESIHTENSYKYTPASFAALAAQAGLHCAHAWHDEHDYFTLYYLAIDI